MKRIPVLVPFLVFVACLFLGLLVYTYVEAKRANPEMIRSDGAQIDNRRADCQSDCQSALHFA